MTKPAEPTVVSDTPQQPLTLESVVPTRHEWDKQLDSCSCGWKPNLRLLEHSEVQWAEHKHSFIPSEPTREKRLEDALRQLLDKIENGRLCYFGDHTGYTTQFGSNEISMHRAALEEL